MKIDLLTIIKFKLFFLELGLNDLHNGWPNFGEPLIVRLSIIRKEA